MTWGRIGCKENPSILTEQAYRVDTKNPKLFRARAPITHTRREKRKKEEKKVEKKKKTPTTGQTSTKKIA